MGGAVRVADISVLTLAILAVGLAPTYGASFDCAKAKSVPEQLICSTPELSQKDDELKILFERAKSSALDQAAFKQQAREQWNYREKNCRDVTCLNRWFAEQKSRYESYLHLQASTAATGAGVVSGRPGAVSASRRGPAPGTIGYVMLRNIQDMQVQCNDDQLSHVDKSWCYATLANYANSAAYWNYVHNPVAGSVASIDAYQQLIAGNKATCQKKSNGEGNWADVNVAACEVAEALRLMGANPNVGTSARSVAAKPTEPTQDRPSTTKITLPARTPAGTPIEADSAFTDVMAQDLSLVDAAVDLIRANTFKCDSISAARQMVFSRGVVVVCNKYAYTYDLKDRGGHWVVTVD